MDWKQTLTTLLPKERVLFGEPMARHTTFRIGGPAECYVLPEDTAQLQAVLSLCRERSIPCNVIGNGSNLLVADEGIRGVVVRMEHAEWQRVGERDGKVLFRASAGMLFSSFAKAVCKEGFTGLEYATGIPGSVGGAVVMNAGAYGGEVKDSLVLAEVLTKDGRVISLTGEELELSYRHSNIDANGYTVLSATFAVSQADDPDAVAALVAELSEKRKEKQPLEYPSAGSTFKRPEGYFAAKLIDDAGLRGFSVGDAQVSAKHCGFVINRGNATAEEVLRLMEAVKKTVFEKFGVMLEPEVRFLGFRE